MSSAVSSAVSSVNWWGRAGRIFRAESLLGDPAAPRPFTDRETPGALRILQGTAYDPGSAAYRFHSAVNETTPHASLFCRWGYANPYTDFRQLDGATQAAEYEAAAAEADVIHCHMDYLARDLLAPGAVRPDAVLVRNYHGSAARVTDDGRVIANHPEDVAKLCQLEQDRSLGAVIVGARLDHQLISKDIQWLPMTQPVHRYAALRAQLGPRTPFGVKRPMRIGHSPTEPKLKGTAVLEQVIGMMAAAGVPITLVRIEKLPHGEALAVKATCDVVFDSFFLGLQGSGLEAGAMGIPVIAGDTRVARLHAERFGECPYVFADNAEELEEALVGLMNPEEYTVAAAKIRRFVWRHHSYEAVARRYLTILAGASPDLARRIALASETSPDPAVPDDGVTERPHDWPGVSVPPKPAPSAWPNTMPEGVPRFDPEKPRPAPMREPPPADGWGRAT
jgi:glycosyl transferase family 1